MKRRKKVYIISAVLLIWGLTAFFFVSNMLASRHISAFHAAIAGADRIVISDAGFTCCYPADIDASQILFEITEPKEIAEFRKHTQFIVTDARCGCMCCGWPRVDWYKGAERVALTSVKHGLSIRWEGFSVKGGYADVPLTAESEQWYANWFAARGFDLEKERGGIERDKDNPFAPPPGLKPRTNNNDDPFASPNGDDDDPFAPPEPLDPLTP